MTSDSRSGIVAPIEIPSRRARFRGCAVVQPNGYLLAQLLQQGSGVSPRHSPVGERSQRDALGTVPLSNHWPETLDNSARPHHSWLDITFRGDP